ncbi:MAG: NUDIX hydrolase [Lachnospiraceae bacterium]|nr:NUDIX hydrolase [Lachnospiraceae bacterium]
MAFLEDLSRFYGTGERNRAGLNLEEFLEGYNPKKYDCPSNTTDIIVVRSREKLEYWGQPLQVLMVKRSNHPSIGFWATPGGFVEMREDLDQGAARELEEETGVSGLPLQQLKTWGNYDRDPRWRVITTSFLALVEGDIPVKAGDDAADAVWMDVQLHQESDSSESDQEIWNLRLSNAERALRISADVKVSRSGHRLLPQERYELLKSDGIAVDHGCLIVQALLYLRSRLKNGEEWHHGNCKG